MTYAVSFKNKNPRLNQTTRWLSRICSGYPCVTSKAADALLFGSKAEARRAIASIRKDNLYNREVFIIEI